jgi:hypothetical protein
LGTKFLARTVIEGGRSNYNKFARRGSHAARRARDRDYLGRVTVDPGLAEERFPGVLKKVRKDFHDKLGPARRWLRRRVGKDWDSTFSEMVRQFDTRTIPGRHIVYDHMLHYVAREAIRQRFWYPEFVVDEQGILREGPRHPRWRAEWLSYRDYDDLRAWLGNRMVGLRGSTYFWLRPTIWRDPELKKSFLSPTGRYRQDRALTDEEVRRWLAFSPGARTKYVKEKKS